MVFISFFDYCFKYNVGIDSNIFNSIVLMQQQIKDLKDFKNKILMLTTSYKKGLLPLNKLYAIYTELKTMIAENTIFKYSIEHKDNILISEDIINTEINYNLAIDSNLKDYSIMFDQHRFLASLNYTYEYCSTEIKTLLSRLHDIKQYRRYIEFIKTQR